MKELLYIPSGRYVRFMDGTLSIEEYLILCLSRRHENHSIWENSYDIIIKAFCEKQYTHETYQSAEIDREEPLLESEFELIDN